VLIAGCAHACCAHCWLCSGLQGLFVLCVLMHAVLMLTVIMLDVLMLAVLLGCCAHCWLCSRMLCSMARKNVQLHISG